MAQPLSVVVTDNNGNALTITGSTILTPAQTAAKGILLSAPESIVLCDKDGNPLQLSTGGAGSFVTSTPSTATTGFTAINGYGDSITAGFLLPDPSYTWLSLVAANLGVPILNNFAVNSTRMCDTGQIPSAYANNPTPGIASLIIIGANDLSTDGGVVGDRATLVSGYQAFAVWLALPSTQKVTAAAGLTFVGTWGSSTIFGMPGRTSSTTGDTATGTVTGTTVYVSGWVSGANGTRSVEIRVDGVLQNTTSLTDPLTGNAATAWPYCIRVSGLSSGSHSVEVRVIATGAGTVAVQWIGGNGLVAQLPFVGIGNTLPNSTFSANATAMNVLTSAMCANLVTDGLNVLYVDDNSAVTLNTTYFQADLIHPTIFGAGAIAAAWQAVLAGKFGAATNQASPAVTLSGTYWDSAASQTDSWTLQETLGTGAAPASNLTFAHTGSTGAAAVKVPALLISDTAANVDATLKNTTAATVSTTNASPKLKFIANYWDSAGLSTPDGWTLGTSLLAGIDAGSALNFVHNGVQDKSGTFVGAVFGGTVSSSIAVGEANGVPQLWFGVTPVQANYTLAATATDAILNAQTGGTVRLRVNNTDVLTANATDVTASQPISVTTIKVTNVEGPANTFGLLAFQASLQLTSYSTSLPTFTIAPLTASTGDLFRGLASFSGAVQFSILAAGKVGVYNGITTVSNGVPSEVGTVDLTGQVAPISATTIYTPTATGMFRISAYLKITTAGTSPVLGPLTITFTDGTDSIAQSQVMQLSTQAGASATSNAGNTTTSTLNGEMVIWAKTAVAIQYAVALTGTVGTGAYEVHLKCEAM